MTIKQFIRKYGWNMESKSRTGRWMSVDVSFTAPDGRSDETSFDIEAYNEDELSDLFLDFCTENGFAVDTVCGITITAVANSFEKLEKII